MPKISTTESNTTISDRYTDLETKVNDNYEELYTAITVLHDSAQKSLIELVQLNKALEERINKLQRIIDITGVTILAGLLAWLKLLFFH